MAHAKNAEGQNPPRKIHITVVIANRYEFDTEVATGKQIKEKASSQRASLCTAARAVGTSRSATTTRSNCTTAITSSPGRRGPPGHLATTKNLTTPAGAGRFGRGSPHV